MGKKPISAKTIMQEKNEQEKAKQYNKYVENKTPKPDLLKDMWGAVSLFSIFSSGTSLSSSSVSKTSAIRFADAEHLE